MTQPDSKVVYKNAFATNYPISDARPADIILGGRTGWKVENENNTFKTKSCNLEHYFGLGLQHLC
jgi:hypothetical protein